MRTVKPTTRTAVFADGHVERVFEAWNDNGLLAGVTFELLESELTPEEVERVAQ